MFQSVIEKLESWPKQHEPLVAAGQEFMKEIGARVFPADVMFLAGLDRAIEQQESFVLLVKEGYYGTAVALLRMQFDSSLRLYALLISENAHDTANAVIAGEHLGRIKDIDGKPMRDAYLVEKLSAQNPDLRRIYDYCSGYIHFSITHVNALIGKSISDSGDREFYIGPKDERISEEGWLQLVNAFSVATAGILAVLENWKSTRENHGTAEELEKRFPCAI
jgi:hypothetical protein